MVVRLRFFFCFSIASWLFTFSHCTFYRPLEVKLKQKSWHIEKYLWRYVIITGFFTLAGKRIFLNVPFRLFSLPLKGGAWDKGSRERILIFVL